MEITGLAYISLGLFLGGIIGWMLSKEKMSTMIIRSEERLAANIEGKDTMRAEFQSMALEVAKDSNAAFLDLAEQRLGKVQAETEKDLVARKKEVDDLVSPLKEQLEKLAKSNLDLEKNRIGAYEGIKRHLDNLDQNTRSLGLRADNLTEALTGSSQSRGNWGEVKLRRLLEIAGMTEHVDFFEQETTDDARPDFVIRLPNSGTIPVDSKAIGKKFFEAIENASDDEKSELIIEHASGMRKTARKLGEKSYHDKLEGDIDYVVMWVPSEALLAAAFAADPDLHEYALSKSVLIATPVTMLALLRTVAIYWQQQALADGAKEIYDVSREMYKRTEVFMRHVMKIGSNLDNAGKAYTAAMSSYENRILPQGRKLENLQVSGTLQSSLPEPQELTNIPDSNSEDY
jgi:DNA recombination protein RmuC